MKYIVVAIVFIVLVIVGGTMFGWIGAIAAIGVGGVVSLAVGFVALDERVGVGPTKNDSGGLPAETSYGP